MTGQRWQTFSYLYNIHAETLVIVEIFVCKMYTEISVLNDQSKVEWVRLWIEDCLLYLGGHVKFCLQSLSSILISCYSICEVYMGLYEKLSDFIVFAKLLNSLINPTLYVISTPTFINSVKKMFTKRRDPGNQIQTRSSNLSKK